MHKQTLLSDQRTVADSLADEHASLAEQEQAQQQFAPSTVLESEFQRLASGHKMLRLDLSKYQQIAPPDQFSAGSEQAWKGCLRNARLMSQCNELRLANLDLLLESGPVAAAEVRKANQSVESQLTNEVRRIREMCDTNIVEDWSPTDFFKWFFYTVVLIVAS